MQRAIAYIRVSTDEQADSRLGIEAQRDQIAKYAEKNDLSISRDEWFEDAGISGAAPLDQRKGLLGALDALKRGDVLIVAKRDRLARDYMLAGWIEKEVAKSRARVISAAGEGTENDDPASKLMRVIIDAFATYEREIIGVRTKAAMQRKVARGERAGRHATFGYRLEGTGRYDEDGKEIMRHIEDEHEQEAIRIIWDLHQQGLSLRKISKRLKDQGYLSRKGKPIVADVIRRVINRVKDNPGRWAA